MCRKMPLPFYTFECYHSRKGWPMGSARRDSSKHVHELQRLVLSERGTRVVSLGDALCCNKSLNPTMR